MNKVLRVFTYPLELVCYALIYFYRLALKPFFPSKCGYMPTCSEYMLQAIREWGVIKGIFLGVKRLIRCNPAHMCGLDPVPTNIQGEHKWVF